MKDYFGHSQRPFPHKAVDSTTQLVLDWRGPAQTVAESDTEPESTEPFRASDEDLPTIFFEAKHES